MPRLLPVFPAFRRFANQINTVKGWCVVCAATAALLAWSQRGLMDPDGLSYLDMATRAANGHPEDLINAYWSPGYPAMISLALILFRPAPQNVFAIVHLVNFFLFCIVTLTFAVFWRNSADTPAAGARNPGRDRSFLAFSFLVFLTLTSNYIGVGNNTPDLMVAGIVFLAATLTCIQARLETWMPSVALGAVLSIGYAVKAAVFPLSLILLAILFIVPPSKHFGRLKVVVASLVFAIGCMPLVLAISHKVGRLTFNQTGTLAYARYVDQVKGVWKDGPPDPRSVLQHGPRRLMETPLLLEFATPFEVTHPLWFEPAYWGAGTTTWFDAGLQLRALQVTGQTYYEMLLDMAGLIAGLVVLWLFSGPNREIPDSRALFWQILWPLAAVAMYALVHTEGRFLAAFFTLFWLGLYRYAILGSNNRTMNLGVLATAAGTLLIPWMAHVGLAAGRTVSDLVHPQPTTEQRLATLLQSRHLHSGDRLAYIGEGFDVYFARLAEMRVVCQIPDEEAFWRMNTEDMRQLVGRLATLDIKAIVAKESPRHEHKPWQDVAISGPRGLDVLFMDDLKRKLASGAAHDP